MIVGPLPFDRLELGSPYQFQLVTVPLRALDDDGLDAAQPRGAALPVAGRDADDPGPLSRARPRPDRRRAGNDRPDLERALQPQDAGRPDRAIATRAASGSFENMLKETIFAATQEIRQPLGADDWCVSVFRRQRRRRSASTTSTTSSSRSRRTIIPRPSSPTAAPTPASAA